jgi:hypothetical protein
MLHNEADGIAAAAATKAFIDLLGGRNGEGGRFFAMERTKPQIVSASFLQLYKTADDLNNVYPAEDLLYRLLSDH